MVSRENARRSITSGTTAPPELQLPYDTNILESVFKLFSESFSALPLATLIGGKYFVLHGGLFSDDNVSLDDIRKLDRHKQRQPGQAGLMMEMLWTDPQPEPGRGPSKRGVGMQFGPDV